MSRLQLAEVLELLPQLLWLPSFLLLLLLIALPYSCCVSALAPVDGNPEGKKTQQNPKLVVVAGIFSTKHSSQ
jgi:hypothetical protein